MDRRQFMAGLAAGSLPWMLSRRASAELAGNAFIISGFPAGGMGDLVSRPLAEKLRGRYATNLLVDNKVGAGGRIATEFVKRAGPDGLTILQIPGSIMTLYPHIYRALNYDPFADFAPVTTTCTYVYSFTASAALPADIRTVDDFIAWARANPTTASYGVPAAGSPLHFAGMMLGRAAGLQLTAVPYRGGAPLLTDMLAGVIPVSFNVLGEVLPHIRSGKLRALAVTSAGRSPFLPEVPTLVEQGFADIVLEEWLGWFLPARTPPDIVQRLNILVGESLRAPDLIESLAASALRPRPVAPEEFSVMVRQDFDRWAAIVKTTGFTAMD